MKAATLRVIRATIIFLPLVMLFVPSFRLIILSGVAPGRHIAYTNFLFFGGPAVPYMVGYPILFHLIIAGYTLAASIPVRLAYAFVVALSMVMFRWALFNLGDYLGLSLKRQVAGAFALTFIPYLAPLLFLALGELRWAFTLEMYALADGTITSFLALAISLWALTWAGWYFLLLPFMVMLSSSGTVLYAVLGLFHYRKNKNGLSLIPAFYLLMWRAPLLLGVAKFGGGWLTDARIYLTVLMLAVIGVAYLWGGKNGTR